MDDHLYEHILDYAKCELIPRFQREYKEYQTIAKCPSYEEIQDLCKILNIVVKYADYPNDYLPHFTPIKFLKEMR